MNKEEKIRLLSKFLDTETFKALEREPNKLNDYLEINLDRLIIQNSKEY